MPYADPEEQRASAREAARRNAERLRAVPRRASFSFGDFRLRTPDDILSLLERTLEIVAQDSTIDSATTCRCFVSIAKTASETLREHGLNAEVTALNERLAQLRTRLDEETRAA